MAEKESQDDEKNFSAEEYYQFSRRRYWTICEFLRLVFNDKSLVYPERETAELNYLHLIFDGIQDNSFEIFKLEDPYPRSLRPLADLHELLQIPMGQPHDYLPSHEKFIVTTRVSAKQAFGYAHTMHLSMDLPQNDFFYDFFEVEKAVKLPAEFLKMGEEIDPQSSYLETLKARDAWTIKDLIRIIFGERFKEYENLNDENIDNFITLIEASINAKSISPINLNQKVNELDIFYKSTDLIEFIWSDKVFDWLMKIEIDILEWVEDLFNDVKIEAKVKEDNAENLSPREKQHKEKKSFFPAPQGTTWNKVGFVVTKEGQIKISINGEENSFESEDLKKIIPKGKLLRLLMRILHSGPSFSRENFVSPGEQNNLRQYVSGLRVDLKKLFGIESDPFKPMGNGEYQTNFSTVSPYFKTPPEKN